MKKRILCIVEAAVLALACVILFSTRTSPLYPLVMGDYSMNPASSAMLVGKGMAEGMLPYKDLFLSAGPVYLLIQALGWMVRGRMGIFALEVLNLFLAFLFLGVMACRELSGKKVLACLAVLFLPFVALAGGGNSSAEWLLAPISLMFYLLTGKKAGPFRGILLGFLSGLCLLISPAAAGMVLACLIYYLYKVEKKARWTCGMAYVIMCLLPFVMILLYAMLSGILEDIIHACVLLPVRMLKPDLTNRTVMLHKVVKCSLFFLPFLVGVIGWKKSEYAKLLTFVSITSAIVLMIMNNNWVIYLSALPVIGLALICVLAEEKQVKTILFAIGILAVCLLPGRGVLPYMVRGVQEGVPEFVESLNNYHQEYPNNKIFMMDTDSSYELALGITPSYKYFHVTDEMLAADPQIAAEVSTYLTGDARADLMVDSIYGQWHVEEYSGYTLVQAFIKSYGNLCVYVSE